MSTITRIENFPARAVAAAREALRLSHARIARRGKFNDQWKQFRV
jgi:hypothetical protein